MTAMEGGHWAVSRSHTEEGRDAELGGGRGGPQSPPGAAQRPTPPTPEPLPQATGSIGVSNLGRFHLHDPQATGSEQSNFRLHLRGSDGAGILGPPDRTPPAPRASPHTQVAGRGGERTPPSRFSGVSGAPCPRSPATSVVQPQQRPSPGPAREFHAHCFSRAYPGPPAGLRGMGMGRGVPG